jgi:hypothetical protein
MPDASVKEIKDYFEFKKSSDFMKEWRECSDEDKAYFKRAVGQILEVETQCG